MYTIDNKFEIGEECYSVYKAPLHYKCPICEGKGSFVYNGYIIECRECKGTGTLRTPGQTVHVVCKVRIRWMKVSIHKDVVNVKYKVEALTETYGKVTSRSEKTLFKTREEAEQYCVEVNTKQRISDI